MSARGCPVEIELADVQGNILTAYGRLGFPFGRFGLFSVTNEAAGRAFIEALRPRVTTALRWPSRAKDIPAGPNPVERPKVTLNLAFTFRGLRALGVPTRTLRGMPDEYIDGMRGRCAILGDDTDENPLSNWDPVWGLPVHILVMLNAEMGPDGEPVPELAEVAAHVESLCAASNGGVALLSGHRGPDPNWQHLASLKDSRGLPCSKEHFGYTDAISDPVFEGQYPEGAEKARAVGFGATDGAGNWRPIATGEFLLGGFDEQGIVMLAVCASLQRQYEFVHQQWMNYGLDSNAGNDTDPLVGNHAADAKFVIPADPASGRPPFIATGLRQWVQTRGGDYFFMPSMTGLRMIAMGVVDPT